MSDVPCRLAGKHVVLRVFADYPTQSVATPDWLTKKGVKLRSYQDHGGGMSPDYDHPAMQSALRKFIAAFGACYNSDPRVAFIELGMLGHWGEWHTYPRNELFASEETQQMVIDTFHEAFPDKHLMARTADNYAGSLPWIGYHDDYFPDDTDNGKGWSFLAKIRQAKREQNWQVAPVGGEMVPGEAKKWMVEEFETTLAMALLNQSGEVVDSTEVDWDIRGWQPSNVFLEKSSLIFHKVKAGSYQLALGVIDPWQETPRIKFANQ